MDNGQVIMDNEQLVPELRFSGFEDDWSKSLIGSLLKIGSGKDYKHLNTGDIPVYGTGGYMTSVDDYLHDGESVCIGRKGTIDKPMFLKGKFWTVDTLFFTHSYQQNIPKFLYLIFQRINWKKYNEASGVPSLSKATIEKIKVVVPKPKEQQKIANFLTAIDQRITLLKEKKAALEDYKKSLMQKIFRQEIRFADDEGNDFVDWEEKKLEEVGKIITGKTPKSNDKSLWKDELDFVTPTDITDDGKYQFSIARRVTRNNKLKIIPENSILYTCIASIGKMSLSVNECITNQQINSLIPKKHFINEFVYYALLNLTPRIKALQANTTLPIINKTEFSKIKILIPCIQEQQKITNFLSAIDQKINVMDKQITDSELFKKGLLQRMFV